MIIDFNDITKIKVTVSNDDRGFKAEITENGKKIAPDVFYTRLGLALLQFDEDGEAIYGSRGMNRTRYPSDLEDFKALVIENIGHYVANVISCCNLSEEFLNAEMKF